MARDAKASLSKWPVVAPIPAAEKEGVRSSARHITYPMERKVYDQAAALSTTHRNSAKRVAGGQSKQP